MKTTTLRWVRTKLAKEIASIDGIDSASLRSAVDDDGEIWAYCGLLVPRFWALVMAAEDRERFLVDGGKEFLRLSYMRRAFVYDEVGEAIADAIEARTLRAAAH